MEVNGSGQGLMTFHKMSPWGLNITICNKITGVVGLHFAPLCTIWATATALPLWNNTLTNCSEIQRLFWCQEDSLLVSFSSDKCNTPSSSQRGTSYFKKIPKVRTPELTISRSKAPGLPQWRGRTRTKPYPTPAVLCEKHAFGSNHLSTNFFFSSTLNFLENSDYPNSAARVQ